MEVIINIEKVVINLNEPNNNLNGLINTKDVVDKINKLSNEELSKRGVGVCSSAQMPTHTH